METEQQARTLRSSRIPIALFALSVVQRLGMKQVLETISDPPLDITPIGATATIEDVTHLASQRTILVASTSDSQQALDLHQRHQWPLLLIAHTLQEGVNIARMIHELPPLMAVAVVVADHTLIRHLSRALHALAEGKPYAEPLLQHEHARKISSYAAEQQLLPELSSRLIQLVVLDFFGWTTAKICDHLQVAPSTVETYWSRVAERLERNRDAARLWVRQQCESTAFVDQLRDYLTAFACDQIALLNPRYGLPEV